MLVPGANSPESGGEGVKGGWMLGPPWPILGLPKD